MMYRLRESQDCDKINFVMRLFIGFDLPQDVVKHLEDYQEILKETGFKGRFVRSDMFHVTLAFLGDNDDVLKLNEILNNFFKKQKNVSFSIEGFTLFSYHSNDTLVLKTKDDSSVLHLRNDLADFLSENNVDFDKKKFKGHITLIRNFDMNDNVVPDFEPIKNIKIDTIYLYNSEFDENNKPQYRKLFSYKLKQ